MDITYIPMARGFVYLAAVVDWYSRRVLLWRLSITMDVQFCLDAVQDAIDKYGAPEIFNTDQGSVSRAGRNPLTELGLTPGPPLSVGGLPSTLRMELVLDALEQAL